MPAPGSKPAPCTPEEARAIAENKARSTEMSLSHYLTRATQAGVRDVRFKFDVDGAQVILLRGTFKRRNVIVEEKCPPGQPFVFHAMMALAQFQRGMNVEDDPGDLVEMRAAEVVDAINTVEPYAVPETPPGTEEFKNDRNEAADELFAKLTAAGLPGEEVARLCATYGIPARVVSSEQVMNGERGVFLGEHEEAVRNAEAAARARIAELEAQIEEQAKIAAMPASPNPHASPNKQEIAADLKNRGDQWVKHGNIRKPPPAGAGFRKPLSLPLCEQCKTQPVYAVGAKFCGGACAKQWHMNKIAKQNGVKLP